MDEIYVNSPVRNVYLEVPVTANGSEIDVTIYDGDTDVHTVNTVTYAGGRYSFILPYHLARFERSLSVRWQFTYTEDGVDYDYDESTAIDVVTPILTDREIKAIHPQATPDEIILIEKAVRHIINAHTGQRFGKFVGTKMVRGNGSRVLQLPDRLLDLTTVNAEDASGYFVIGGGGWTLEHFPWGVPPVKADYYGLHMHTGGVIHNPNHVRLGDFQKSRTYEINGTWGWTGVPAAVKEAAKLLVNDYACGDAQYRDRYLTSMTAADWRIQFNAGAFSKTGNVRADQLLADYVLQRGWTVI